MYLDQGGWWLEAKMEGEEWVGSGGSRRGGTSQDRRVQDRQR